MKKGFLQRFMVIVFVLILCVLFTGCKKVVEGILENNHDEKADAYLEKMIDAILQNDADAAYSLFCDGAITYAEICAGLEGIRTDCDGLSADYTYTLTGYHKNAFREFGDEDYETKIECDYRIESGGKEYLVNVIYYMYGEEEGLIGFDIIPEEATIPTGTLKTAKENNAAQWIVLIIGILESLFMVFTVVDIFIKRPRRFGWFIVPALISISFGVSLLNNSFNMNFNIGILGLMKFLKYADGGFVFSAALPVGAIVYWCMRKYLLRKKAEFLAQKAEESAEE